MKSLLWVVSVTSLACSGGAGTPDAQSAQVADAASAGADAGGALVDVGATQPDLASGADAAPATPDAGPDAPARDVAATADAGLAADLPPLADAGAPAELVMDMGAFIFGPTPFSCESAMPAVLTVSNVGGSTSSLLRAVLEGAFPDRFRIEKDGCGGQTLAVGASCVVQVRFGPKQLMDQPATANLVVRGVAGESAEAALSGESNVDNFEVFPLMAGLLDFQTVKVGSSSPVLEDIWTNNTDFPAVPGAPVLTGVNAADFTVAADSCSGKSIPARQSCRIGVQMKPSAAGQRFAGINITATGACGYDFADVLTLVGVGE